MPSLEIWVWWVKDLLWPANFLHSSSTILSYKDKQISTLYMYINTIIIIELFNFLSTHFYKKLGFFLINVLNQLFRLVHQMIVFPRASEVVQRSNTGEGGFGMSGGTVDGSTSLSSDISLLDSVHSYEIVAIPAICIIQNQLHYKQTNVYASIINLPNPHVVEQLDVLVFMQLNAEEIQ